MTLQEERRNGLLKSSQKSRISIYTISLNQWFSNFLYQPLQKIFVSLITTIMTNIKFQQRSSPNYSATALEFKNEAVLFLIRIFIVVSHFNIVNTQFEH